MEHWMEFSVWYSGFSLVIHFSHYENSREAFTLDETFLWKDWFCMGVGLGFGVARKAHCHSFPVEWPSLPLVQLIHRADSFSNASSHALSASYMPSVYRSHKIYLLPNLLSTSKSFLIYLRREELNSFLQVTSLSNGVTLCLSTSICPLPSHPC